MQISTKLSAFSSSHLFFTWNPSHHTHHPYKLGLRRPPPASVSVRFSASSSSSSSSSPLPSVSGNEGANDSVESAAPSSSNGRLAPSTSVMYAADWKAAQTYFESGSIYEAKVQGFNAGGLLVRFYSLVGFLPFKQLSPSHSCKDPQKSIQDVAKGLAGSLISVKVIQVQEYQRLIFSEKEAVFSKLSDTINLGDIFQGLVAFVEDYGALIHLCFPDGLYHLTGLVHASEVSWDLVRDMRDFLHVGDEVRVKVISIDREKSRINLSIKQLEDDPLLETLDKVIPQDGSLSSDPPSDSDSIAIDPLPGLQAIMQELLLEDGIVDIKINREGFEKRVVSQDLQIWLSSAPPVHKKFTLLARAGRQVQEIQLTTTLDQEGIKGALQRALTRIP